MLAPVISATPLIDSFDIMIRSDVSRNTTKLNDLHSHARSIGQSERVFLRNRGGLLKAGESRVEVRPPTKTCAPLFLPFTCCINDDHREWDAKIERALETLDGLYFFLFFHT